MNMIQNGDFRSLDRLVSVQDIDDPDDPQAMVTEITAGQMSVLEEANA